MVLSRRFLSADLAAMTPGFSGLFRTKKIWKKSVVVQTTVYQDVFPLTSGKFSVVRLSSYHSTTDTKNGHDFQIYVDGDLLLEKTVTDYSDTDVLEYPIHAKTSLRIMARARYASIYGKWARAEVVEFS